MRFHLTHRKRRTLVERTCGCDLFWTEPHRLKIELLHLRAHSFRYLGASKVSQIRKHSICPHLITGPLDPRLTIRKVDSIAAEKLQNERSASEPGSPIPADKLLCLRIEVITLAVAQPVWNPSRIFLNQVHTVVKKLLPKNFTLYMQGRQPRIAVQASAITLEKRLMIPRLVYQARDVVIVETKNSNVHLPRVVGLRYMANGDGQVFVR